MSPAIRRPRSSLSERLSSIALCGRTVRLLGTLDEPDTANFDTQVIMTVERVESQSQPGQCVTLDHTRHR